MEKLVPMGGQAGSVAVRVVGVGRNKANAEKANYWY